MRRFSKRPFLLPYLDWFVYDEGAYVPLRPDEKGIIRSRVFPGLWLSVEALLADDLNGLLNTLQQGIASAEHAAFLSSLKDKATED